ncbi:MAG TPA: TIGR03013 family PEP-CTERM/XrtA system glycosyltransferase [Gammaproteobacteria bacterium]|nr:TIGR03013 family PEP-CTERM/XrtA system glycosyltransferase [Gammaproteobacteria bacterium]
MSTLRFFKHHIRVPFVVLGSAELLCGIISVYAASYVRFSSAGVDVATIFSGLETRAVLFAGVILLCMIATGLYQTAMREGMFGVLLRLVVSYFLGVVVLAFIFYSFPVLFLGRGVLILSVIFSATAIVLLRIIFFKADPDIFKRRALILGTGKRASTIAELRRKTDQFGFKVLGYVHLRGSKDVIEQALILKLKMPLKNYCLTHEVDEIVIAIDDRRKGFPVRDLLDCKMSGIEILDLASFFERETGKIRLDQIHPSWLMLSDGFNKSGFQTSTKRIFDLISGLMLLAITWPFMLFTVVAIKLEDGINAPVIFSQIRIGEEGRPYKIFKFRSMRVDAEKNGKAQWAVKGDSRITRVGHLIRTTRFDELPQIFNVVKGNMSFVGPRPERPEFAVMLSEKIEYFEERHRVKPGITGWAQIRYPYGASDKDALEKLQYDLYYVKNQSLLLDFLILLQTVEVILFGKGSR